MTLTAGFTKVCESRSGGLLEIFLANEADVDTFTLSGSEYSAVVMSGGAVFFKFEFEQDTAEIRETVTLENGSTSAVHELEFFLAKLRTLVRDAIQEIIDASACGVIAIAKDANGKQWVLGFNETALKERPMRILSDTTASGKAFTDLNGSTVILQSLDGTKAREFTGTVPV